MRHFDQSLQALAHLDQPFRVKLDILNAVDEYVFGYCSQVGDEALWLCTTLASIRYPSICWLVSCWCSF